MYHIMTNEELIETTIINNSVNSVNNNTYIIEIPIDNNDKNNEIEECLVCFNNINTTDGILILDCCNKKLHLTCIIDWYTNHPEKKTCFICNQSNNFCKDLVDNQSPASNSNTSSIQNSQQPQGNNSLLINNHTNNANNNNNNNNIPIYIGIFIGLPVCISFIIYCTRISYQTIN